MPDAQDRWYKENRSAFGHNSDRQCIILLILTGHILSIPISFTHIAYDVPLFLLTTHWVAESLKTYANYTVIPINRIMYDKLTQDAEMFFVRPDLLLYNCESQLYAMHWKPHESPDMLKIQSNFLVSGYHSSSIADTLRGLVLRWPYHNHYPNSIIRVSLGGWLMSRLIGYLNCL